MTTPRFCVLGPLTVACDGGEVMPITAPLHRAMLTALLLRPGQACGGDWLASVVWGDRQPRSRGDAVRTVVHGLRRELRGQAGRLRTRQAGPQRGGWVVDVRAGELDTDVFADLADAGRRAWYQADPGAAALGFGEALELWRGEPFADLPSGPVVLAARAAMIAQRRDAEDMWMDSRLALGHHAEAVPCLRSLLEREPQREHAWAQLMRALYRCGDRQAALDAFSSASAALTREYGAGPGPELTVLRQEIMAGSAP